MAFDVRLLRALLVAPAAVLEELAGAAEDVSVVPGGVVFRAGEEGDCFYVVKHGAVEISANCRVLATEAAGGSFGEIALLRNVPRTATATAPSGAQLYVLRREAFLAAPTGHTPALERAEGLASQRLAGAA
jgi:CRP-like cAMP-binding protein